LFSSRLSGFRWFGVGGWLVYDVMIVVMMVAKKSVLSTILVLLLKLSQQQQASVLRTAYCVLR